MVEVIETFYKAIDGEKFLNKKDCLSYEKYLLKERARREHLSKTGCVFCSQIETPNDSCFYIQTKCGKPADWAVPGNYCPVCGIQIREIIER